MAEPVTHGVETSRVVVAAGHAQARRAAAAASGVRDRGHKPPQVVPVLHLGAGPVGRLGEAVQRVEGVGRLAGPVGHVLALAVGVVVDRSYVGRPSIAVADRGQLIGGVIGVSRGLGWRLRVGDGLEVADRVVDVAGGAVERVLDGRQVIQRVIPVGG